LSAVSTVLPVSLRRNSRRSDFARPAPTPTRSEFSYTYELPLPTDRFAGPAPVPTRSRFSYTCELPLPTHRFAGPAPAPTRSGFLYTYELPLAPDRFAAPFLSWTYELLFPQLLYFEKHLRCPMFFRSALCFSRYSSLATRHFSLLTLSSHTLANSSSSPENSTPLQSSKCELFPQTPGVGEYLCETPRTLRLCVIVAFVFTSWRPGRGAV
jgi:hypothetical protein